jgi:GAF domain-containing protein
VPLINADRKLGVLNLSSVSDKIFNMHDLKLIQMLASYSTIAIQSALDLADFKRAVDELTMIVDNMGI